ncbi:hypothetical protein [Streptomyces sp. NPDC050704]|uniref:hypothetical protein n=1 Tax=Streptomyces sp. NPDC050704 TaxID=3157219 RepID=UPI0034187D52
MITYLILTATLSASAGFTLGFRMRPFTPPAPGCPCRGQTALDAQATVEQRDEPHCEDVIRGARLNSLGVLLSRIANGITLTSDEAQLLIDHIDIEVRESTTAREIANSATRRTR